MKLLFSQIILLSVLVTVLAGTHIPTNTHNHHQGASSHIEANRHECRWIKDKYKCIYQTCTVSLDGKKSCTTREGPPTAEIIANSQSQLRSSRYQCRWIDGRLKCRYQNCTLSVDGKRNCTTREGPPPADIDQERFAAHTTKTKCNWKADNLICTIERCTIYPNGKKSCSTTTS